MKKFLLSIFAVMLAVFSVQAETKTYTYDFSKNTNWVTTKGGSTAVATGSGNKLNAFYDKATGDLFNAGGKGYFNSGYFLWGKSGAYIELPTYSGEKITKVTAKSSSGVSTNVTVGVYSGTTSVVSAVKWAKSTSYDYKIPEAYQSSVLRLQVANAYNAQIVSITITTETTGEGGGETPDVPVVETVATPVISPESTTFNEGESLFVSIATETQDAEIYYTLDGTDPSIENGDLYEDEIEITETTTVKAIAVKKGWNNSEVVSAKYTKTVVIEGGVVDVLNLALTGAEGTTYSSWSGKTSNSSAVYAGNSAGGNNSIQLRSATDKGHSGIVTTVSGGKVKKISIDWNSNTAAARELWVYGSNTAYTSPADLYDASTDGDKLAEIVCGTTEFVIEGDYEYIGLRSGSGAMYLNSIEITWVEEEEEPATETWSSFYAAFPVAIPEGVEAYIVTAANAGYVTLTQIYNAVPANTGVILKGGSIEATYDNYYSGEVAEVTGNLLKGTMANDYISEEAYVLAKVDGVIGLYKAEMNQLEGTAWLNNANKAYLPASAVPAEVKSLAFRFPGTTGIENVVVENGVNVIFDLTGRKVESISAPGIYIVNGVKRVVR